MKVSISLLCAWPCLSVPLSLPVLCYPCKLMASITEIQQLLRYFDYTCRSHGQSLNLLAGKTRIQVSALEIGALPVKFYSSWAKRAEWHILGHATCLCLSSASKLSLPVTPGQRLGCTYILTDTLTQFSAWHSLSHWKTYVQSQWWHICAWCLQLHSLICV